MGGRMGWQARGRRIVMDVQTADTEMNDAHAAIGRFVARCSLLDYRVGQFMARWFCAHEKQKFLSYTLMAMPFAEKRQVIEERLTRWHADQDALRAAMAETAAVFERRKLVISGVLSRRSSGAICIKSFSGARFLSHAGAVDIIDVADLTAWSERARELTERVISLGTGLRDAVEPA
jgi:hypothetical protein